MRWFTGVAVAVGFNAILVGTAYAADIADCDKTLVMATSSKTSKLFQDYRLAELVTEDIWKEASHGGDANAVIYGIPMGASYADYQKNVTNSKKLHNESFQKDEARNEARTGLDVNSSQNYQKCVETVLQLEAATANGLHIGITSATDNEYAIMAVYNNAGVPSTTVTWSAAKMPVTKLHSGGRVTFIVPRPTTSKPFFGTLQYRDSSNTLTLAPLKPLTNPARPVPPAPVFLSDQAQFNRANLYGFNRDQGADPVFEIWGVAFTKGVYTHPNDTGVGSISYHLDKKYRAFKATIGLTTPNCNCNGVWGHVQFSVMGDGKALYKSQSLSWGTGVDIDIDVSNVTVLTLAVENKNTGKNFHDQAGWGSARLIPNG